MAVRALVFPTPVVTTLCISPDSHQLLITRAGVTKTLLLIVFVGDGEIIANFWLEVIRFLLLLEAYMRWDFVKGVGEST